MLRATPRPAIAVTTDFENKISAKGVNAPRFWLSDTYVRALAHAGAHAYLLPPNPGLTLQMARERLAPMHGLIVSGGAFDVDPARYGQAHHPLCGPLAPERTAFEALLLQAAEEAGMPCLGICAGMQLMVVQHGGTLYQDVQLRQGTGVHEQPFDKTKPSHAVALKSGSMLSRVLHAEGSAPLQVNSTHHQLVDAPGTLEAVGHSPDGVIEAVEDPKRPFYVGVQWHPEALGDGSGWPLYEAFVAAARTYAESRTD